MASRTVSENTSRILTEGADFISKKFRLPCEIDPDAALVLAQIATFGKGARVWHGGKEVQQDQLKIKVSITQQNNN